MAPLSIRIKELRQVKGWTQAELAEVAGVTRATVNRFENGRSSSIDLVVLEKLADALGTEPGYLIVREPEKKRARPS